MSNEVIKLSTKTAPESEEREPFLEIDGKSYTLPVEPSPAIAVQYLRDTKARGAEYAVAAAFETMLGAEGLKALSKCGGLTKSDLAKIMTKIQDKITGLLEEVAGN